MTRRIARLAAVLVVLAGITVGVTGCTSAAKPDEPVAFAQAWLQAVVDHQKRSACQRVEDWLTPAGKELTSVTCEGVYREVGPDNGTSWPGVSQGSDVKKTGGCAVYPVGRPNQTVVRCYDAVNVLVVDQEGNLMLDGLTVS